MSQEVAVQTWLRSLESQLREKGCDDLCRLYICMECAHGVLSGWRVVMDARVGHNTIFVGGTAVDALHKAQNWVAAWEKPTRKIIGDPLAVGENWAHIFAKQRAGAKKKPVASQPGHEYTPWIDQPNKGGKPPKGRK